MVKKIISKIDKEPILIKDILDLFEREPELIEINSHVDKDEGNTKSAQEDDEFLRTKK